MERKKSLAGTAASLRRRFRERVTDFKNEPSAEEKPTLGKFLLFILLFLILGLLGFYMIGIDNLFQFPTNMSLSPQGPSN
ncbi:hypothetical protein KHS38_11380 [Mucilaginibacter sp. Bleaf8]|uniref:hypothetical protein n=1 Tax=Mucilaginibacter sp. Bleaf8 TaxID=2834430 RepID=UPI001BD05032|nr:hypothetical protein [Mucilaginibacter sp. Bleaf8]MBS7565006.1 hypothetical protein [Mucilaginibacter sp. Bleaf8]